MLPRASFLFFFNIFFQSKLKKIVKGDGAKEVLFKATLIDLKHHKLKVV